MKLNAHLCGIVDCDTWKKFRAPKKPDIQWKDGRSAKELAKYITKAMPNLPVEIETVLKRFTVADTCFDWDAEYVTKLPGTGEGRNHDAILYNKDVVVGIEAKADETLGRLIEEEISHASVNKLNRIASLMRILFQDGFKEYGQLRYQLLTAATGTILEAQSKGVDKAVLLVLVFRSEAHTKAENLESNNQDIQNFLSATNAVVEGDCLKIPNNTNINLYFKKIEIKL